ncbi:MAG: gluconokinase [Hyphomicrobiales bacterium]|nr:gluconokinase [Hyphomicrobiales bacterium]PCJ87600.1 MAG: gluconokinase [Hyphomicrobiales bacterium]
MSMVESQPASKAFRLYVIMGVAGCGKTTIGEALACAMGSVFLDGDTFHPAANVEKMSRGDPLTDEDRWPWLEIFGGEMAKALGDDQPMVIGGCSSLKKAYRQCITKAAGEPVLFIYLDGSRELISSRMAAREGHFMPTSLLDSQFATLEIPRRDEAAVSVDIDATTDVIVARIQQQISAL